MATDAMATRLARVSLPKHRSRGYGASRRLVRILSSPLRRAPENATIPPLRPGFPFVPRPPPLFVDSMVLSAPVFFSNRRALTVATKPTARQQETPEPLPSTLPWLPKRRSMAMTSDQMACVIRFQYACTISSNPVYCLCSRTYLTPPNRN